MNYDTNPICKINFFSDTYQKKKSLEKLMKLWGKFTMELEGLLCRKNNPKS